MALTPDSFLSPAGLVERIFFPSDNPSQLRVRLQGYIDAGGTVLGGSGGDVALSDYVYWRVFDAVHTRLAVRPAKVSKTAEGSTEYLLRQIDSIAAKAAEYLEKWQAALVVPVVTSAPPTQTLPVSFSV